MKLYVNGDSHSAGAEAVNAHCFAEDDSNYRNLGRIPHPSNLKVSYGKILADTLSAELYCDAESASSNDRIIRSTDLYLSSGIPNLIIIGWSTWEREEFFINGEWYQFSSGIRGNPWSASVMDIYKKWVVNADPITKEQHWHEIIYQYHLKLKDQNIPHVFFNTYSAFNHEFIVQYNWEGCYIDPYTREGTYYHWLKQQGFWTVNKDSYHYGPDAHAAWAEFLLTYIKKESIMIT